MQESKKHAKIVETCDLALVLVQSDVQHVEAATAQHGINSFAVQWSSRDRCSLVFL